MLPSRASVTTRARHYSACPLVLQRNGTSTLSAAFGAPPARHSITCGRHSHCRRTRFIRRQWLYVMSRVLSLRGRNVTLRAAEQSDHLAVEGGNVVGLAAGDEVIVNRHLLVRPIGS